MRQRFRREAESLLGFVCVGSDDYFVAVSSGKLRSAALIVTWPSFER
jgi:hypothetical protein